MAITKVNNAMQDALAAAQPTITSVGTLTSLAVDTITIDGSEIDASGSLTFDVGGNLTINVDGSVVSLADDSVNFGQFFNSGSGDFNIYSPTSNKDIVFRGSDGGTGIIALTLDMSDSGAAIFNSTVTAAKLVSTNGVLELDDNGSHNGVINVPAGLFVNIDSNSSSTNETFRIAKDRTGTSGGTELFRINEVGILSAASNGASVYTGTGFHTLRNNATNDWIFSAQHGGNPPYGIQVYYSAAAPNNTSNFFLYCTDTTAVRFFVMSNGNVQNRNNSYTGISDLKLKQDIVDASNQWDDIKNIRFRKYKFKTDVVQFGEDAPQQLGVIAQELEAAGMAGLVSESPDIETHQAPVLDELGNATFDENGDPITEENTRETGTTTKSVNYSVMNLKAMVALQEAMTRIETLEARLTALEGE